MIIFVFMIVSLLREFTAVHPARSLLHPAAAAAGPLLALEWIVPKAWRTSWALLVASRLPTFAASFVIGMSDSI